MTGHPGRRRQLESIKARTFHEHIYPRGEQTRTEAHFRSDLLSTPLDHLSEKLSTFQIVQFPMRPRRDVTRSFVSAEVVRTGILSEI